MQSRVHLHYAKVIERKIITVAAYEILFAQRTKVNIIIKFDRQIIHLYYLKKTFKLKLKTLKLKFKRIFSEK